MRVSGVGGGDGRQGGAVEVAAAAGDSSIIRTRSLCNNDSNVNDGTATSIKTT